ncbi:MAG: TauD/TfdA family dioxygenase [Alphaproteobacteria bacterium]|nr:TauD/TfdA family dioxygenase [Alphaproteobacteria bacterium]
MMAIGLRPLHDAHGVEVQGVDLAKDLDDATFARILDAHHRYGLVLLRDQKITPGQHIAFSRRFGELEIHVLNQYLLPGHPEVLVLSNRVENGKQKGVPNGGWIWHSDLAYMKRPSLGSLLYAHEVPDEGGDTLYAGMHAALEGLSPAIRKQIAGRSAVHSYAWYYAKLDQRAPLTEEQKAKTPPVEHPIERTHPVTGRKALYVFEAFCDEIPGMPQDEARALLAELFAHSVKPDYVYAHRWLPGDILFWDNRCTMHRATPYDQQKYHRTMHRTTVTGDVPF